MVAAAHRDAELVEHLADVVRMDAFEVEGDDGQPLAQIVRADESQPRQDGEAVEQPLRQARRVGIHGGPRLFSEPIERRAQADGRRDRWGAGLEAARRRSVRGSLDANMLDHAAAAEKRRQCGERLAPAPQHADAGGAEGLVAGEGVEVDAERGDIHRAMLHGLGAVEQHARADGARRFHKRRNVADGAGDVRGMRDRHESATRREGFIQARKIEASVCSQRQQSQNDAAPLAQQLPRHEIAVVLYEAQHDLVARLQHVAERMGDEVDRSRGAGGEHDFIGAGSIQVGSDLVPRMLVGGIGALGQAVGAAQHIGARLRLEGRGRVHRRIAALPGRGIVEIVQGRLCAEFLQQGKVLAPVGRGKIHDFFNPCRSSGVSTSAWMASSSMSTARMRCGFASSSPRAP